MLSFLLRLDSKHLTNYIALRKIWRLVLVLYRVLYCTITQLQHTSTRYDIKGDVLTKFWNAINITPHEHCSGMTNGLFVLVTSIRIRFINLFVYSTLWLRRLERPNVSVPYFVTKILHISGEKTFSLVLLSPWTRREGHICTSSDFQIKKKNKLLKVQN